MGGFELVIIAFIFGMLGVWGWSLVDILGRSDVEWKAIGQEKTLWLLVVLLVGLPGSLGYLLAIRPKFARIVELTGVPMPPMLVAPAPGWYPDPQGAPMLRWFDGRLWTPHTAPMGGVPGAPPPGAQPPGPYPGAPPPGPWPPR